MRRWVALFRGINVGGRNRVAMPDLRALAESVELRKVETYIQSGNLVFDADFGEQEIVDRLTGSFAKRFGFEVSVVAREADTFRSISSSHPFSPHEDDLRFLVVAFFDRRPAVDPSDSLPRSDFAPDRYAFSEREMYLHYPDGSGRSKLTNEVIEKRLGLRSTMRNWKTISRLAEMLDDA